MQKLLLLFIFTLSLFSQDISLSKNPNVYTSIGDIVYDNIEKIESLKRIEKFEAYSDKIDAYALRVRKAKSLGFGVESGARSNVKLDYLKTLRELEKVNAYFMRTVKNSFSSSIETSDNDLFIGLVNSGLINTAKNKRKIMSYYKLHKDEIAADGIIQEFLDEAYAKKNKKKWKPKTKKQLEEEKISRLRINDKLKQMALEKKLAEGCSSLSYKANYKPYLTLEGRPSMESEFKWN